ILLVPDDVRITSGMLKFNAELKCEHGFLASKQLTRKAVLPFHTAVKFKLFGQLMHNNPFFNQVSGEPLWKEAVKVWNQLAESENGISYKLIEHLKTYYSTWKTRLNAKYTLMQTADVWGNLDKMLQDPSRLLQAP
ncbi:hypothetical protein NEOLEDRAFT_1032610, partial [Neolentinus lepideus HHB14362 ss-1]